MAAFFLIGDNVRNSRISSVLGLDALVENWHSGAVYAHTTRSCGQASGSDAQTKIGEPIRSTMRRLRVNGIGSASSL